MSKYLCFFVLSIGYVFAETLEKKKILEIIKAAKQHKTVPNSGIHHDTLKSVMPKSKPLIVYRKNEMPVVYRKREAKKISEPKHVIYGTLPALAPSGIELEKKFNRELKAQNKEMHFIKPQENRVTGVNTEAIEIEYE